MNEKTPLLTRSATIVTRATCCESHIHGEFFRWIFLLYNKQADDYFHRRGVFFHRNRCSIGMACAQAVAAPPGRPPHQRLLLGGLARVVILSKYSRLPRVFGFGSARGVIFLINGTLINERETDNCCSVRCSLPRYRSKGENSHTVLSPAKGF
jgi:hypothetical protein